MNEKLIELAKAAGFETLGNTAHIADEKNGLPCVLECTAELAKFAEIVRADERKCVGETQQILIKDMGTYTVPMDVACHILDLQLQLQHERKKQWQPIETAPKDGTAVWLFCPSRKYSSINIGCFEHDRYAKNPRPFWSYSHKDTVEDRKNQPTHWMPQEQRPAPPESEAQDGRN